MSIGIVIFLCPQTHRKEKATAQHMWLGPNALLGCQELRKDVHAGQKRLVPQPYSGMDKINVNTAFYRYITLRSLVIFF